MPPSAGRPLGLAIGLVSIVVLGSSKEESPPFAVDLLLVNARIYTGDPGQTSPAGVLAVRDDGRIVGIGGKREMRGWQGSARCVLDVGGRAVVPGLVAAHGHVLELGEALTGDPKAGGEAADVEARLTAAQEHLLALGFTAVHDLGIGTRASLPVYERWAKDGRLRIRVAVYLDGDDPELLREWFDRGPLVAEPLRVVGLSLRTGDSPADTLVDRVRRGLVAGFQPAIHVTDIRETGVAIDAYEDANITPAVRARLENARVVAPADLGRLEAMGLIASPRPAAGSLLACGGDSTNHEDSPFLGFHAAVTRQNERGPTPGEDPGPPISRRDALECLTRDAAFVAGMEDEIGTLAHGFSADFLVLDRDPLSVPAEQIPGTKVLLTVIRGKAEYRAPPLTTIRQPGWRTVGGPEWWRRWPGPEIELCDAADS